ncbi:MAG: hypothetical protein AAGK47_00405 [Bacteroidota bacterium]
MYKQKNNRLNILSVSVWAIFSLERRIKEKEPVRWGVYYLPTPRLFNNM